MSQSVDAAGFQHDLIGVDQVDPHYERTTHPQAQWFPAAGLGMFLHWGLSSVDGNMDLSWGMMANTPWDGGHYNFNKMRPVDYWRLAERFDPAAYDPAVWMRAAAAAGVRYVVLTARHHEGFALWPSEFGHLNTRAHMGGRDLLQEYVAACRACGLKVGFYYSPPDWYWCRSYMSFNYGNGVWPQEWADRFPEAYSLVPKAAWDERWEPRQPPGPMPAEFEQEFARYIRGQVCELLTRYGQLDIIWFDGNPFRTIMPVTVDEIRALQPGILINPRLHGVVDFETPECHLPEARPAGWWEGCFIWNHGGWGYSRDEIYHSTGWFLDTFARHRTWSGNLLINCAPRPDGRMPATYYRRMAAVEAWVALHGETLFGTRGGPFPEACDMPVTLSPQGDWFIHLTTRKGCTVTGRGAPRRAVVHGTGKPIGWRCVGDKTLFMLRYEDITELDDVIVVEWD
ncbi:MAG: alpha-L-fucosidase [Gemmatimonadota bacterium]